MAARLADAGEHPSSCDCPKGEPEAWRHPTTAAPPEASSLSGHDCAMPSANVRATTSAAGRSTPPMPPCTGSCPPSSRSRRTSMSWRRWWRSLRRDGRGHSRCVAPARASPATPSVTASGRHHAAPGPHPRPRPRGAPRHGGAGRRPGRPQRRRWPPRPARRPRPVHPQPLHDRRHDRQRRLRRRTRWRGARPPRTSWAWTSSAPTASRVRLVSRQTTPLPPPPDPAWPSLGRRAGRRPGRASRRSTKRASGHELPPLAAPRLRLLPRLAAAGARRGRRPRAGGHGGHLRASSAARDHPPGAAAGGSRSCWSWASPMTSRARTRCRRCWPQRRSRSRSLSAELLALAHAQRDDVGPAGGRRLADRGGAAARRWLRHTTTPSGWRRPSVARSPPRTSASSTREAEQARCGASARTAPGTRHGLADGSRGVAGLRGFGRAPGAPGRLPARAASAARRTWPRRPSPTATTARAASTCASASAWTRAGGEARLRAVHGRGGRPRGRATAARSPASTATVGPGARCWSGMYSPEMRAAFAALQGPLGPDRRAQPGHHRATRRRSPRTCALAPPTAADLRPTQAFAHDGGDLPLRRGALHRRRPLRLHPGVGADVPQSSGPPATSSTPRAAAHGCSRRWWRASLASEGWRSAEVRDGPGPLPVLPWLCLGTARPAWTWPPTSRSSCTTTTGADCVRCRTTRWAGCRSGCAWRDRVPRLVNALTRGRA